MMLAAWEGAPVWPIEREAAQMGAKMDRTIRSTLATPGGRGECTLYVLGFHKIGVPAQGGWETWFYIPEPIFEQQLRCLTDHKVCVIDLATLLGAYEDPDAIPERAVLLTFDDGCRSMYEVALPLLRRFDFPAVLFVPSDYVGGRTSTFDPDEPDEPLCTWDDLQLLQQAGVSVQSHGASHRHLSQITTSGQWDELTRSKTVLEARLGTRVEALAYPYGDCAIGDGQLNHMMRVAGYRVGFVYGRPHGAGPNNLPFADPFRLKRVPMGPETDVAKVLTFNDGASKELE